ncbi:glycerophosphocholine phosphodiesterase GPCPD1 isoform X1 [Lucilia sericata]|uniref:glycerophosphocholine phosphodiesterase GPCPD1 isoform X1 n=1 Tax=Lucilia sericata TaxID=13632 RepID=UPI0018A82937|nr:glycerophosphocholine phosphodiesterase GPCPD1 isoform X1 [Lucilia sericata]
MISRQYCVKTTTTKTMTTLTTNAATTPKATAVSTTVHSHDNWFSTPQPNDSESSQDCQLNNSCINRKFFIQGNRASNNRETVTPTTCSSYVEAAAVIAPKFSTVPNVQEEEAKIAVDTCVHMVRPFTVILPEQLAENEHVALTGDSQALGEWQLDRCVTLTQNKGSLEWSANVMLQACANNINYRYFIYAEDHLGRKQIRRWETHLKPRQLTSCINNCRNVDIFGQVAAGEVELNRGWLNNEMILQLKFEREKMFQVHDINKFDPENVYIKVVVLGEDLTTSLDAEKTGINVEFAKMRYNESVLKPQPTEGVPHKRNEVVIFHLTVPLELEASYALEFYSQQQQLMGKAYILADQLKGSQGELLLEIKDTKETVIARLTLPYLLVKPFSDKQLLDFRTTYAHYWPKTWPNLDVGHRGNGKSYIANAPAERENTISSFLKAYEVFADMVELDVHLTADGIPVIYHDFGVRTAPQGKEVKDVSQLEYVLLKDMTYEAIKELRVFAIINNEIKEYPAHNKEPVFEKRIFPTLEEVLEALPKTLGIDVEIKWPQRKIKGGVEAEQTIDKNFFIDTVLKVILQKGCGRPLIFSSFDADICTMLRFKQNLLPVMYLTQGETQKWEAFLDLRTRTFEQAINNAQAFELAGTAPHAEDFKGEQGAALMKKAKDLGQISLVWGDDCNSQQAVKYFQDIGATATCYDRSDLYVPPSKSKSFFNSTEIMEEFKDQCRA